MSSGPNIGFGLRSGGGGSSPARQDLWEESILVVRPQDSNLHCPILSSSSQLTDNQTLGNKAHVNVMGPDQNKTAVLTQVIPGYQAAKTRKRFVDVSTTRCTTEDMAY